MCLARVEFATDETEQTRDGLTDIAWIERTSAGLQVIDLFGNVTELEADIRSIDFMSSVVRVESCAAPTASQEDLPAESGTQTQDSGSSEGARR